MNWTFIPFFLSLFSLISNPESQTHTFQNPVFEPVLADPTVLKTGNQFYAFGTEDNWAEEGGYHLVPVLKSTDLIHWDLQGDSFESKPSWKPKGGIWAPDVTEVNGQYYMYYSFSTWGDPNPGIGLAISTTPNGPFMDQGPVFTSEEIGVKNSIDPFYWEDNGKKYLIWGSFHGLYLTALSEDGKKAIGDKIHLAGNHLEAAYVHFRNGFYYLFGSAGTCCEGENSSYRVLVGRASKLEGPYLDQLGKSLLMEGSGTLVLQGNAQVAGPGHNAEIITDDHQQDWLLYHGMLRSKARLSNGANRRSLFLDPIQWESEWPTILNQSPNLEEQTAPYFQE